MKENNVIADKSKVFAIWIIRLYQFLQNDKKEFTLSKQLLRSGTSIGANTREAIRAQSTKDFQAKLHIALKEAEESAYWIELLFEKEFINNKQFESIYFDCNELIKLLVSIINSSKSNNLQSQS